MTEAVYKNKKFHPGARVDLIFNPKYLWERVTFDTSLTSFATYDELQFWLPAADGSIFTTDDVFACNQFGGNVRTDGANYYIQVSKDCFFGGLATWLVKYNTEAYLFDTDISENKFENAYISKAQHGVKHGKYDLVSAPFSNTESYKITLNIVESDFDKMSQMFMSKAVAVMDCDPSFYSVAETPTAWRYSRPVAGGSMNPIVRMGVVDMKSIKETRERDVYEVDITLLG